MIASWKASRPRPGAQAILYPGEPEHLHEMMTRRDGIALPRDMVARLCEEAGAIGVAITPRQLAL